jgi:hypothetical protein
MATLFVYFDIFTVYMHIHSITFIQYTNPQPFAEVPLHRLIAGQLSGYNLLLGCLAENRTRACHTSSRCSTY